MKPEITIAILTHNRSWHFAQCVASIRQFTKTPYKIFAFDVGSNPEQIEHMKQFHRDDCADWGYCDTFISCLEGRRRILNSIDTEFVVYLDDDIRVGPEWLGSMLAPMRRDPDAAVVAPNISQEGAQVMSGIRERVKKGASHVVRSLPVNHEGKADMCMGGATLYRADILRETELRKEFSGGYEDWDQTLQITQDLKKKIYGCRATVFHKHMKECDDYFEDRWRWRELMDSAIGMWDRWNVRTAVDRVLTTFLELEIAIPREQAKRVAEVISS